jgi:branched-chain amino acid transport system ATP-binding protein
VSLQGSAQELAATDEVQRLYLGHGADAGAAAVAGVPAAAPRVKKLSRWNP